MKLYGYYRSSAAYRVRIALNLKNLPHELESVHLTKEGGRQFAKEFQDINVQMRVPALTLSGGEAITQSLAIIEYLEEAHPNPPLLPSDPVARAHVRAAAQLIACDIHPLNNLAPLRYIKAKFGQEQPAIDAWYRHWVTIGFKALERMLKPGPYAFGSRVTMADICLVPQVYNARRFAMALDDFPNIAAVEAACLAHPAFDRARPENQPDAE